MDLSGFGLGPFDWPALPAPGTVPDTLWAALLSALVTLGLALRLLPRHAREAGPSAAGGDGACDFLINGASIQPITAPARALLASFAGSGAPLQGLARYLARDCPTIQDDVEALVLYGEGFRRHCTRIDGSSFEVIGQPRGAAVLLSIRPATAEARALDAAERALARARLENGFQREALDRAPLLVWTLAPDGQVTWANATYRDRFASAAPGQLDHRAPAVFDHVLEEVPLTGRDGCESRRRVKISDTQDGEAHWFEVSQLPLASGETLGYAIEVDDLVAAEASLRRFVETLTETFAHLPIGLAVFDKNRRLGLFNPALSDLVKIDAVWLAGRPSLRDFLERLRETRQMPEQKDFAAFRRMLTELEEGARDGTYEENWQLPSGKIFRVTGRPHPQGALAFLFEDISPTIQLERRYRSELELSQATLDRIGEAVAVFDTSGMLVFVNAAFERLWGLDPMQSLEGPGVGEMVEIWAGACPPSPVWNEVTAFVTGAESRSSWGAVVDTRAGEPLHLQVAPLPNGSTLVTFRDRRAVADPAAVPPAVPTAVLLAPTAVTADAAPEVPLGQATLLADLALAELELPAEAALRAIAAAAGASREQATFAQLAVAAQGLKDGLARAQALQAEAEAVRARSDGKGATAGLALPPGLVARLGDLLARRGFALGPIVEHDGGLSVDSPMAADTLAPLALALAALAEPGAAVEVALGAAVIALRAPATPGASPEAAGSGAAALALARRRLEAVGSRLEIAREDDRIALAVRFPAPRALAAPRAAVRA
jgi:PAS domain-containing protein